MCVCVCVCTTYDNKCGANKELVSSNFVLAVTAEVAHTLIRRREVALGLFLVHGATVPAARCLRF